MNHEPPLKYYARLRARDHDNVPVLLPGAFFRGDRPLHWHSDGKEMQGEDPEPHSQKDGQQGYKLSHCRILRNIHRHLRAVFPVVCNTILLHTLHLGRDTH